MYIFAVFATLMVYKLSYNATSLSITRPYFNHS